MQAVFLAFMWKQMWAEDGFFYLFYGETSFQLPFLFTQKSIHFVQWGCVTSIYVIMKEAIKGVDRLTTYSTCIESSA